VDTATGQQKKTEGFIYSSKSLLLNIKKQYDGVGSDEIAYTSDATFGLLDNGWVLYSVGCTTLVRYDADTVRSSYRPFMFLLSRTERGDGYAAMFRTIINVVLPWLDIFKNDYRVKVISMDHSDGLYNAAKAELNIGNF
jgi:hypothetical protein